MTDDVATPAKAGFSMPAEWERHAACLMSWPYRLDLWQGRVEEAKRDYAAVARAIAAFEPLVMICPPGLSAEVRDRCGGVVETLEFPINDSWIRDCGPIFVRNARGDVAAVGFVFNAWGERWHPYDDDAKLARRIASHMGVEFFSAPFVLEGGSIFVDGAGTVFTTEQCLLNPNRNPALTREQIADGLREYLGVSTVIWLPHGYSLDVGPAGTDGHIDGIAQIVEPGHVLLMVPSDPASPDYSTGRENLAALQAEFDSTGAPLTVSPMDPPADASVSYANFYLANGGAIVPTVGDARDDGPLESIAKLFPDREVIGVPGEVLDFGGGGPHCITQQVPAGVVLPAGT
jgi:agmatine deiminase